MRYRLLLCALLLCWPCLAVAAGLDQAGDESLPVELEADQLSYDRENGIYRATGDVRLTKGDVEIQGPSLQWNQQSGEIIAEEGIKVTSPTEQLSGSSANYNINEGTGIISGGTIFLKDENLHIKGEKIERLGENDYHVEDGTFTTCDGDVPSWKFGASSMDVTLGGYARARNMVFYLKDIPSVYFPYMIYPAKTERESGLLIPSAGYSDKRGFQYNAAYYQVLGVNQDATFYLDYLSKMGIGKGLEYRYIFAGDNAGEAHLYHIDVDEVDDRVVDEERYAIRWDHKGTLPGGVQMIADVEYVNDDDYFSDFGGTAGQYNKDKVESVFSLTKSWGKTSLAGQLKYTKDLETDTDTTLQMLPRITLDVSRTVIASSIFAYSFESQYTHFWRREGVTGQRLMAEPTLSADFQLWDVISVTPELSYRERVYWDTSDGSDNENIGLPEFTTKVHTTLQRIYPNGLWRADKLKHSLEPEVIYRFIPEKDQTHLPSFDTFDRIEEANEVEYALVQRLTARFNREEGEPTYRDLLYFRLSQTYNLTSEASGKRFEEIRAETKVTPLSWLTFDSDVSFDVDSGEWSETTLELDLGKSGGNFLGLEYKYDRDDATEYGKVNLIVDFLKPVYLSYTQRYDFTDDTRLEESIGLEYRQQCWSALLSFTDQDDSQSIKLIFTMKGIGSVGAL